MLNGGDAAVLYCFVFLYMAVAGGGEWSVDAIRTSELVWDEGLASFLD